MPISETYTLLELSKRLGIPQKDIIEQCGLRQFPFPAVVVAEKYYFPKKPIDDWIRGIKTSDVNVMRRKNNAGAKRKWYDDGHYRTWNYKVPSHLNDQFDIVIENMNRNMDIPLTKQDFVLVCIQEFIERRPEYLQDQ